MNPTPSTTPTALTIAGSDSCGGAGLQADLKTFAAFGVYGASVVTALTAQNTLGVQRVLPVEPEMVGAQLASVLDDLPLAVIKTGMMGGAAQIETVCAMLGTRGTRIPLVMDPVMVATSGAPLADDATIAAMRELMGCAALVTPNLDEAAVLGETSIHGVADMRRAAERILATGCQAVLIKGGHLAGPEITDLLVTREGENSWRHSARKGRFHGTGCTLASAAAAGLALGHDLETSVEKAIAFVQEAMQRGLRPVRGDLVLLGHNRPA